MAGVTAAYVKPLARYMSVADLAKCQMKAGTVQWGGQDGISLQKYIPVAIYIWIFDAPPGGHSFITIRCSISHVSLTVEQVCAGMKETQRHEGTGAHWPCPIAQSCLIKRLASLQATCNMCFTLQPSKDLVHQQFIGRKAKATLHYSPPYPHTRSRTHTHIYIHPPSKWMACNPSPRTHSISVGSQAQVISCT